MGWREGQGIGPRVSKIQSEDTGKAINNFYKFTQYKFRTYIHTCLTRIY